MNDKMHILLVSATINELAWLHRHFKISQESENLYSFDSPRFHVNHLISGVGIGLSAVRIASELNQSRYDFSFQAGIAGSYTEMFPVLSCAEITSDIFGEIITLQNGQWVNLSGGLFQNQDIFPTECGVSRQYLPKAKAITVNAMTSEPGLFNIRANIYDPQMESMEGASFFAACHNHHVPCFQWRCVSNFVGARESGEWNLEGACKKISELVYQFLTQYE